MQQSVHHLNRMIANSPLKAHSQQLICKRVHRSFRQTYPIPLSVQVPPRIVVASAHVVIHPQADKVHSIWGLYLAALAGLSAFTVSCVYLTQKPFLEMTICQGLDVPNYIAKKTETAQQQLDQADFDFDTFMKSFRNETYYEPLAPLDVFYCLMQNKNSRQQLLEAAIAPTSGAAFRYLYCQAIEHTFDSQDLKHASGIAVSVDTIAMLASKLTNRALETNHSKTAAHTVEMLNALIKHIPSKWRSIVSSQLIKTNTLPKLFMDAEWSHLRNAPSHPLNSLTSFLVYSKEYEIIIQIVKNHLEKKTIMPAGFLDHIALQIQHGGNDPMCWEELAQGIVNSLNSDKHLRELANKSSNPALAIILAAGEKKSTIAEAHPKTSPSER